MTLTIGPVLFWVLASLVWLVLGSYAALGVNALFMDEDPPGGAFGRAGISLLAFVLWPIILTLLILVRVVTSLTGF